MKRLLTILLILAIGSSLNAQSDARNEQVLQLYRQADTSLSEGDLDKARLSFEKLLKLDKMNQSDLYLALGRIAEDKLETGKAIRYYQKAIKRNNQSHKAYYSMGALYYNRAIEILKNVAIANSDTTEPHRTETAQGLEYLKKALPYLDKGFQLSGDQDIYQTPLETINYYLKPDNIIVEFFPDIPEITLEQQIEVGLIMVQEQMEINKYQQPQKLIDKSNKKIRKILTKAQYPVFIEKRHEFLFHREHDK